VIFPEIAIVAGLSAVVFATDVAAKGDRLNQPTAGDEPRILFLGNSITHHQPAPGIGWNGDWGMAASAQENDYVHILLARLMTASGGNAPTAMIVNIAEFERQYATYDVSTELAKCADFKPDIVILAIGENVPPLATDDAQAQFRASINRIMALLTNDNLPAIFVRSSFWPDEAKDTILRQECESAGGVFVDIGALAGNEENFARSTQTFQNPGVAAHPGDAGMLAIVDAIWAAMTP
jgi:hypothetical protein